MRTEGFGGIWTGWFPTAIGYSIQGAGKFGFYEYFKKKFADFAGEDFAYRNRTYVYLAASASAEIIADVGLCPWEAVKVRMQTSATPFATSTAAAFSKIVKNEGAGALYKGLSPLWFRQVPYTMVKFSCFERTVEAIYKHVLSKPKAEYSKPEQLGVTFVGGYIAGVFCAVVSHPADTVVSKLNNMKSAAGESTGAAIGKILRDLGPVGVWRGLTTRILMIGTLTGLQWFIYDTFKVYAGLYVIFSLSLAISIQCLTRIALPPVPSRSRPPRAFSLDQSYPINATIYHDSTSSST